MGSQFRDWLLEHQGIPEDTPLVHRGDDLEGDDELLTSFDLGTVPVFCETSEGNPPIANMSRLDTGWRRMTYCRFRVCVRTATLVCPVRLPAPLSCSSCSEGAVQPAYQPLHGLSIVRAVWRII